MKSLSKGNMVVQIVELDIEGDNLVVKGEFNKADKGLKSFEGKIKLK